MRWNHHWAGRYGLALAAVGGAEMLRVGLTALVGPGLPTYVTYYPVVMLTALLLGFGPGVVATVASALVVSFWILPPVGRLAIGNLVDAVGLALFCGMGLFMSVVAELYRRARGPAPAIPPTSLPGSAGPVRPAPVQALLLNAGFGLALAVLAFVGWRAFREVTATSEATRRETHAQFTLRRLDQLLAVVREAESAERGFALTGEETYLDAYKAAPTAVATNLALLMALTQDDPRQQKNLASLAPLLAEKFAEIEQIVQARRHQGLPAALGALTAAKPKGLLEKISDRVADAQREEQTMLEVQRDNETNATRMTLQALLAGGVLSLLVLAAVFLFLKQENQRRLQAEAALLRHRSQLQQEVAARTAELEQINQNLEKLVAGRTAEVRATAWYARSLLEASLDPLVTISQEGKITDVNQATELVTALSRERLIGSDFSSYFTEPDQARRGYRQVLAEGLVRDYPLTIRQASGRTVDVLYNATVYRNEAGQVQGVFAAARDITERKRLGNVLRESEARYRSLVTATAQIVWTTDAQGRVTVELPGWQAFTGQRFDQYGDAGWTQAIHPDDRAATAAAWSQAVATGGLYETEYRLRRHDGQYRHMAVRGVPVSGGEGRVREWVGTCTDVTERRDAERRRELTNALLALFAQTGSIKEYLESVVAVIRQWSGCEALGIRILNADREIPYEACAGFGPGFLELENRLSLQRDNCCCTRAVAQAFEPSDQPLLTPAGSYYCADQAAFIGQLPPEKQDRYRGNCLKAGFASVAVVPIRYRNQAIGAIHLADPRPNQFALAMIEFLETMAPLVGEAVHRFQAEAELAKYRDHLEDLVRQRTDELVVINGRLQSEILERKRAQEILHETAQELERSNRDLEQFAYVASHDLQEPLRAVGGYVKLLQRRFPDLMDAKAVEFVNGAADGAARMERLITDLLAFARVGTRGGHFTPVNLNEVLQDALENLKAGMKSAQARVTSEQLPVLAADPTQMVQLFQNLIGNALKFRREDRPLEIQVGARQQEGRWLLSVRDNGIGIEPQYFERIFQIFQRLHTRKHYPGTGIGLAICKRIAERHGGSIWVESQPGQGSTFYLSLPELPVIKEPAV